MGDPMGDTASGVPPDRDRDRDRRRSSRVPRPAARSGTRADRSAQRARRRSLRPPAVATAPWQVPAALVVLTVVAFLRLGGAAWSGPVWAEDAGVFLQRAYAGDLLGSLLEPYAGYALVLPRVQAAAVTTLPLAWQGVAICLLAAATVAAVAVLVLVVARAHLADRAGWAWVAALAVVAVPVGPETIGNIANGQWYLLVGATVAPLWTPGRVGHGLSLLVVLVTALTCPFAFVPVGAAGLVWILTRDRQVLVLVATGAAGVAVQAVVVVGAPPRPEAPDPTVRGVVAGFLRRVLGDGLLGASRHDRLPAPSVTAGVVVLGLLVLLVVAVGAVRGTAALAAPAHLLASSVALYLVAVVVSGVPTEPSYQAGRYYVAPAALVLVALALLGGRAWQGACGAADGPRARAPLAWATRALGAGLVLVAVVGAASSYRLSDLDARASYPGWASQVDAARARCVGAGPRAVQPVSVSPPGWQVVLSCRRLDDG